MWFSFDTETELVRPGLLVPPMVCMTWTYDGVTAEIAKWDDPALPRLVRDNLENPEVRWAGANTPYDAAQIVNRWPDLSPLVWQAYADGRIVDVLTNQKILDIAKGRYGFERHVKLPDEFEGGPYGLQAVYYRHTRLVLPKDGWRLRYGELRNVHLAAWPADAIGYAKDDALATEIVREELYRQASEDDLDVLNDAARQSSAKWWLYLMSAWGITTDLSAVDRFDSEVTSHLRRLQRVLCRGQMPEGKGRVKWELPADIQSVFTSSLTPEMRDLYGKWLDTEGQAPLIRLKKEKGVFSFSRDTKAAKARMLAVCAEKGIKPSITNTGLKHIKEDDWTEERCIAEGLISLDDEACRDSCDDVLIAYSELTSLAKLASTDIPVMRRGLVQSRYEEIQDTGRTGSSNPNMQNLPRFPGVRECYVARPGYVFVDADYDIVELRTLGQICLWVVGHSVLAEKLNNREDPHLYMGAALARTPYDVVKKDKKKYKVWRQRAKPINFGVPGGMGPPGLMAYAKTGYGVILTLEEAAEYREMYLDTWPEVREYFNRIRSDLPWRLDYASGMRVTDIKHFKSNRYRGGITYTKAANSFFQGLASDLAKAAGFRIARECYDPSQKSVLFGSRIVNFIHDQFIVECPEAIAHECAARVGFIMQDESKNWIPDVPATTTPALSRRFSKATEAIHYENGRLCPYDDALCACGKGPLLRKGTTVVDLTEHFVDDDGIDHRKERCAA